MRFCKILASESRLILVRMQLDPICFSWLVRSRRRGSRRGWMIKASLMSNLSFHLLTQRSRTLHYCKSKKCIPWVTHRCTRPSPGFVFASAFAPKTKRERKMTSCGKRLLKSIRIWMISLSVLKVKSIRVLHSKKICARNLELLLKRVTVAIQKLKKSRSQLKTNRVHFLAMGLVFRLGLIHSSSSSASTFSSQDLL